MTSCSLHNTSVTERGTRLIKATPPMFTLSSVSTRHPVEHLDDNTCGKSPFMAVPSAKRLKFHAAS